MNLPVEDEYHCSRRHLALVTVILLLILFQTPGWCLNMTFVALSSQMQYPQLEVEQCLERAANTIHFYTGLNTEIEIRVIFHPNGFTFQNHNFPNWSAAVYREGEIHLRNPYLLSQKGILENTLSHELFHAVIHQNSLSLPQWFEEGFADFLFPVAPQNFGNKDKENDASRAQARDFYINSYSMVKNLMIGKNRSEIQDFFLLCQEVGFYSAFQELFKVQGN